MTTQLREKMEARIKAYVESHCAAEAQPDYTRAMKFIAEETAYAALSALGEGVLSDKPNGTSERTDTWEAKYFAIKEQLERELGEANNERSVWSDHAGKLAKELGEIKDSNTMLCHEIEKSNGEIERLKEQLRKEELDFESRSNEYDEAKAEIERLKAENKTIQEHWDQEISERMEAKARIAELEKALTKVEADLQESRNSLRIEINGRADAQSRITELEKTLEKYRDYKGTYHIASIAEQALKGES